MDQQQQSATDQCLSDPSTAETSASECGERLDQPPSKPSQHDTEMGEAGLINYSMNIIQDCGRECPSVPLQSPSFLIREKMETHPEILGHLTIVPTIDSHHPSDQSAVGSPDHLVEGTAEQGAYLHPRSNSNMSSHSDIADKLSSDIRIGSDVPTQENVDRPSDGGSSVEESVLPSMGILPETAGDNHENYSSFPVASSSTLAVSEGQPPESRSSSEPKPGDPSGVEHKIKKIKWQDIEVPIITQNNNGPCPLIAIVNVMLLKGQITFPPDRSEITGGELVLVVGNALFDQPRNSLPSEMRSHLEQNTEDAIQILHKLLTGLDVNVKFSGVRDFEFTSELCVFDLLGITLYHGWVVDPASEVADVIKNLSYNQLTNNIFAWREEAIKKNNNDLLVKAMLGEEFMSSSGSQLTVHGLFELGSALGKEEIAVLFRNNHFSTIYKRGDQLYQLLTDQGFLHENMVWETLNDVDATFSEFVNGNFQPVTHESEAPPTSSFSSEDTQNMTLQQQISSDQQLAAMLQHEVDQQQRQQQSFERLKDSLGLHNMSDEEIAQKLQEEENRLASEPEGTGSGATRQTIPSHQSTSTFPHTTHEERKKRDCVIL